MSFWSPLFKRSMETELLVSPEQKRAEYFAQLENASGKFLALSENRDVVLESADTMYDLQFKLKQKGIAKYVVTPNTKGRGPLVV